MTLFVFEYIISMIVVKVKVDLFACVFNGLYSVRVAFFAESRGSAVKFRRNSHYGKSPIAYPPKKQRKFFLGSGEKSVTAKKSNLL